MGIKCCWAAGVQLIILIITHNYVQLCNYSEAAHRGKTSCACLLCWFYGLWTDDTTFILNYTWTFNKYRIAKKTTNFCVTPPPPRRPKECSLLIYLLCVTSALGEWKNYMRRWVDKLKFSFSNSHSWTAVALAERLRLLSCWNVNLRFSLKSSATSNRFPIGIVLCLAPYIFLWTWAALYQLCTSICYRKVSAEHDATTSTFHLGFRGDVQD